VEINGVKIEEFYLFDDRSLVAYRARFLHRVIVESSLEALREAIIEELSKSAGEHAEHERKKQELRARLEVERRAPLQTVTTDKEMEISNEAYWVNPPPLRVKYMKEAEEARERYGPHDEILKLLIEQLKEHETA
jgi:hypothetical protein